MKKVLLILFLVFALASTSNLFAQKEKMDIIYLKDGGIYMGKIILYTNDYLKIKTNNGTYNPSLDNIRKISYDVDSLVNLDNQLMKENLTSNVFQPKTIPYRNPGIATLMSLVFPGGGQFYNAQSIKGIGFFLWSSINYGVIAYAIRKDFVPDTQVKIFAIAGVSALTCWIYGMYDANSMAKKINQGYINIASFNLGNNKTLALNPDIRFVNSYLIDKKNESIMSYGINIKLSF